jgi:nitroreductase
LQHVVCALLSPRTPAAHYAAAVPTLDLSPDALLSTTRAVRKRLDLTRPVPRELLEECLALAVQAPTASDSQPWAFVVVTEPEAKAAIAEHYRRSHAAYTAERAAAVRHDPEAAAARARLASSSQYLADHFHEVPAFVLPCVRGRLEQLPYEAQAARYGSIVQAGWSFQLAARARGLGTCWTTLHLPYEREVAELLDIPYDRVSQVALITVGYSLGTDFKPARRGPLDGVVRWERW